MSGLKANKECLGSVAVSLCEWMTLKKNYINVMFELAQNKVHIIKESRNGVCVCMTPCPH